MGSPVIRPTLLRCFAYSLLIVFQFGVAAAAEPQQKDVFKNVRINPSEITISGVSSGGFMAVQFEVAHSDLIQGAAVFAGGIYGCAEGSLSQALSSCMESPADIQPQKYIDHAISLEKAGVIASLQNLRKHRAFLFAGTSDSTVKPNSTEKLFEFYRNFLPAGQIKKIMSLPAEHGLPTLHYGSDCRKGGSPWLLNCRFDGAGTALKYLYGTLSNSSPAQSSHFFHFNQSPYASPSSFMDTLGSVYIPQSCASGNPWLK